MPTGTSSRRDTTQAVNADERTVPSFLYIGTSKAGSTWLFNALSLHPDIFLASSKGLYYFDAHFDKGEDWYLRHFIGADGAVAAGEISHGYLSSPESPSRIAALNPAMRLLACLREPADRAFSDYLDLVKNKQFDGSFEAALERFPRLIERGRYATHLRRYLDVFPATQLLVGLFDDLRADPQGYANAVYEFLGVSPMSLPPAALRARMPAGVARSPAAASAAKRASRALARLGLRRLRSQVKRSRWVRGVLYRPFDADRPTAPPAVDAALRSRFREEVAALDDLLGLPVRQRWGY